MPSSPIVRHARSFKGRLSPVLPFLAPPAVEHPAHTKHTPRWMTAHGIARKRTPHAWTIVGKSNAGFHLSASPSLSRPRLRPQYSSVHGHGRRSYSTADDDYLVEEEEETRLEASPFALPRTLEQHTTLMNPEFRALRRFAYLVSTQEDQLAPGMQEVLARAGTFLPLDKLPQQDIWWIKKFAHINALHDVRLPLELRTSELEINASTEQAVKLLFSRGISVSAIRKTWIDRMRDHYSPEGKRNIWCEIMLWLLHHDHTAVLPALEAFGRGIKAPSYVVADILEQFLSKHLQLSEPGKGALPTGFIPTLSFLLDQKLFLAHALSQKFFHLTLAHSTVDEAKILWNMLRERGFRPSWFTYYHIGHFFGRHGEYEMALEALQKPVALGALPTHWAFVSTCALVLRSSVTITAAHHASSRVLSKFIEMGVSLHTPLYTVLMHNAVDHGDLETALNVFDLMLSKGLEPNDYTYTVLLKGLKDGENPDAFREIIRQASQALPRLERPRVVATDLLHCLYLIRFEPARSESAFAELARAYHEYFDPSPLIRLGVPEQYFGDGRGSNRMAMTPGPPAIGIVWAAYLQLVSPNNPEYVLYLYRIFRHCIDDANDHVTSELGGVNYFYNALLLAIGQHASMLHLMPDVLRQMTDKRIHPEPLATVHTWDILINAFMRHGKPEAAERVKQTMEHHGHVPNQVTWNSIVKGYARLQDVDNVLNTIRDMQLQKFTLGDDTLRLLGKMKEGHRLRTGLRNIETSQRTQQEEEQDYLVPDDYQEDPAGPQTSEEEMRAEIAKEEMRDEISKEEEEPDYLVPDDYQKDSTGSKKV